MAATTLPDLAPYPATWRNLIVPEEWVACLDAWIALTGAYLSLSGPDFARASKEASLPVFLKSYVAETARSPSSEHMAKTYQLRKLCYFDFVDSLVHCYKTMNPPLRKVIVSTLYLCLIGLTEGESPNFSSLVDHLYSLKAAADTHKAGPRNANDSLVAELVTNTPVLKQVQQRIDAIFNDPTIRRPVRLNERKVNKGKGITTDELGHADSDIHRMSLISQVQDLFPDLGSGFIVNILDEYNDNVEQVVGHLLEGPSLQHLESADRSEEMDAFHQHIPGMAPRSPPPSMNTRRNIFDDDEFDKLAVDTSRLHFGRRDPDNTADDILQDRSTAPSKAAILSALAAFDSDDDERDDTYDVEDVGGTVDSAAPGNNPEEADTDVQDAYDEALFKAYKETPNIFGRDAATRKGKPRLKLKEETRMTDEAIEGWGLMLSRDSKQMRRLEAKFSHFPGAQRDLGPTAWRAGSGTDNANDRGRGGRLRGSPRGGGRGRGRDNVTGPTGDKETEVARNRKEANKASRANHNRRDQRARKMARGGFAG
ncbi:hypothetical protein JHW43_002116 [Diplocarpon mali]|nr:hypothetical protein JHW43_002116 [Diplocarpon mali]